MSISGPAAIKKKLADWAAQKEARLAFMSSSALEQADSTVRNLIQVGEIDREFYRRQLRGIVPGRGRNSLKDGTLMLVALRRPAHILRFETSAGNLATILPPTYVNFRRLKKSVLADLVNSMGRGFPEARLLSAPLKTLAILAGMASYGKNNITYIEGFGSYHQLFGYVLDADPDSWASELGHADRRLKTCENCRACFENCPTGSIRPNRFLLHAETCLTLFSETPGDLPQVQDKLARHDRCLIGCLVCQTVCPANKGKLEKEEAPVSFDLRETNCILKGFGDGSDPLWKGILKKVGAIGMLHTLCPADEILSRNLRFLLSIKK